MTDKIVIDSENETGIEALIQGCNIALEKTNSDFEIDLFIPFSKTNSTNDKNKKINLYPTRLTTKGKTTTNAAARHAKDNSLPFLSFGDTKKAYQAFAARVRIKPKPISMKVRPVIACFTPTNKGYNILTDAGAITEPITWKRTIINMILYAISLANIKLNVEKPTIGFLGIGEEISENKITQNLWKLVDPIYSVFEKNNDIRLNPNFYEPDAYLEGHGNIIIADGFVGNTNLKCLETAANKSIKTYKEKIIKKISLTEEQKTEIKRLEKEVLVYNPEFLGAMPCGPTHLPFYIGHRNSSMGKIAAGIIFSCVHNKHHKAINNRFIELFKSYANL